MAKRNLCRTDESRPNDWSGSLGLDRQVPSVSGGPVLLDDAGRYAAAVRQLDLVGRGPGPDSFEIQVAAALGRPASPASLAGCLDPRTKLVTELLGVPFTEVQLVGRAVEAEADALGGFGAVNVINEQDLNLLCHCGAFRRRGGGHVSCTPAYYERTASVAFT